LNSIDFNSPAQKKKEYKDNLGVVLNWKKLYLALNLKIIHHKNEKIKYNLKIFFFI